MPATSPRWSRPRFDEFEGRAPGSKGEELTVNYIRDQMQRIGLQPGNGDSWFRMYR